MFLTQAAASTGGTQGNPMTTWLILGLIFIVAMVFFNRSGKKRVAQMEQERQQLKESLSSGTWVRTTSGFYGKVVEVSGDVVTLENLTGEETLWDARAIAEVSEPNFGSVSESSEKDPEKDPDIRPPLEDADATPATPDADKESKDNPTDSDDIKFGSNI